VFSVPLRGDKANGVHRGMNFIRPEKLPSHIPRDLTASLLRPCYDPGRSTVAMDAAGTQRGRSEERNDAQGRRPSANILNMHKTVAETLHSC